MADADIVSEASEFGGLVLPSDVTVLGTDSDHGLDSMYQLVISTDQGGLDELLASSGFTVPLTEVYEVTVPTIAGPPLETSPVLLGAQDRYQRADGKTVSRKFVVDQRDMVTRIVHIQVFDT